MGDKRDINNSVMVYAALTPDWTKKEPIEIKPIKPEDLPSFWYGG